MSSVFDEIEEKVRTLSPEERARLVEMLLESLRDTPLAEVEAEWEREIRNRVAEYERGEAKAYAAEDVFAEARRLAR